MTSLLKFKNFVDEITENNGRLYKQNILQKYKNDQDIKFYLHWIFSPFVITGISSKKINKKVQTQSIELDSFNMSYIFNYLSTHKTGTDYDIGVIQHARSLINDSELCNIYDKVITKDFSLGIDAKTINAVMPGCVEEFNVQLANKYFDNPEHIVGKEFAITTKIDGGRIIALKEKGRVHFYTRQGQIYEGLVDLEHELLNAPVDDICFDGELTLLNPGSLTSKDQYKTTMKESRKDGEKHGLRMLVFDIMAAEQFRNQVCNAPYALRRRNLEILFNNVSFTYFNLLPVLYQGTDIEQISTWLNYNVDHGEEGIMLNVLDAPYDFKRTWSLQKVKKMKTLDLEIVDFFEGNKQFSGMLGGFIVKYKNNNTVRVGSGFDKQFRQEAWKNPSEYIGKIIEVQYFEETKNADGGISLRFPVFKDFRFDKSTPDF